jgi:uncharacterized glyoxalase superfamily protein PhnB
MSNLHVALRYRDAHAAIAFLKDAFGFREVEVVEDSDGRVVHAELAVGDGGGVVMLGTGEGTNPLAAEADASTAWVSLYVDVADADAHCERARAAGAEITRPLNDTDYGSREYGARDPEGYLWSFGTYAPRVVTAS